MARVDTDGDPLEFWRNFKEALPQLPRLAQKYLGTPCSSVYSERLFSELSNIFTDNRTSLQPDRAESLLFLHHNLRLIQMVGSEASVLPTVATVLFEPGQMLMQLVLEISSRGVSIRYHRSISSTDFPYLPNPKIPISDLNKTFASMGRIETIKTNAVPKQQFPQLNYIRHARFSLKADIIGDSSLLKYGILFLFKYVEVGRIVIFLVPASFRLYTRLVRINGADLVS